MGNYFNQKPQSLSSDTSNMAALHNKCRNCIYPLSTVNRKEVVDNMVNWTSAYPQYFPILYVADSVRNKPVWADPDFIDNKIQFSIEKGEIVRPTWNDIDGRINRKSHVGRYILCNNVPVNPMGRTGICGRGLLGRWGPNHAADPIVTRWKRDEYGEKMKNMNSNKYILQFVCILRRDGGGWAIPGGMVDAGEEVSVTLKREFKEEAMSYIDKRDSENETDVDIRKDEIDKIVNTIFNNGTMIYKGYVDDPRNTDNAWMETIAKNFHDENGNKVGKFHLHAGDDATGVKWMDIDKELQLYASHSDFIHRTALLHDAHW